jgi:DNA-binding MarR family transcriptional regulator
VARRSALATRQSRTPAPGSASAAPQPVRQSHSTNLDRVIHDQTRLSIMSALAVNETLSFTELKAMTETTDGNLSVHARKLEDAGYLRSDKSFAGRTPRTDFTLTASGRRALTKYLDHMEALIRATRAPK